MALPAGEGSHVEGMGQRCPRQSIEGAPLEGTDLNRWESRCPEPTILGWHPPMPEDVLIPPVVSASSESLEEEPQWIPDYSSTQGNQHLSSAQPSAPGRRTPTLEDWQAEEWQRAMQAVKDITTGQPTPTFEENQMYDWDGQFDDTLGLPIQLRNRVSNPGTPPVRASPRAPGYGGVQEEPLWILGVGPGYTRLPKIQRGTVWVRPRNCLCSEEKVGVCPHTTAPIMENPNYQEYSRLDGRSFRSSNSEGLRYSWDWVVLWASLQCDLRYWVISQ